MKAHKIGKEQERNKKKSRERERRRQISEGDLKSTKGRRHKSMYMYGKGSQNFIIAYLQI